MATNKHAIIRYQTLDKCFRNLGRRYFMDDLIKECNLALIEFSGENSGVKRRQLFEDIRFMESSQGWSIPLRKFRDGRKVYYRYEDLSFSINNQPLNDTEVNQLKEALLTLSRFKGLPQFEWVDELTARLDSGLGLSNVEHKVIEFEQNQYLKGLEHITPLYNAILFEKVVSLSYQSFKQTTSTLMQFHPYFLKQYNNRWFALGKTEGFDTITNVALDRILSIEDSNLPYQKNVAIDFEEYFEEVIGVSFPPNAVPVLITLKVENSLLPYIQTKPLHGSQKIKPKEEQHSIITLELIPNYELESLILSYGERMEVIQPETLKIKIKTRIQQMNSNYADKLHS